MKILAPFSRLTKFERALWLTSLAAILLSFLLSSGTEPLTLIASLIGVTSLILLARGAWQGQVLMIVFSVLYAIISFRCRYYGEMITYLGMTLPMSVLSLITWIRHPFKNSGEVAVGSMTAHGVSIMVLLTAAVTTLFYFVLRALGTASLIPSTLSITTSYLAAHLTFCRMPYFALGYAINDIVLILLWVLAALHDPTALPMIICFCVFLVNDLYGFLCWMKMCYRQRNK